MADRIRRKLSYFIYLLLMLVFGILMVPQRGVWGPQEEVYNVTYAPIWMLAKPRMDVNGYMVVYELDVARLLVTLLVITLVMYAEHKIFRGDDQR
ncbi:hypothetical protein [Paenibacillus methanolicus]|uniref:YfzA-like protein n=1 Tax=Paenibacillus methanolicus TaxID=582686 RepID=A0A5S5C7R1_9BACL|nr:hypothetical protein [Paenibacillus methanolicus]TYP75445.1 hypothetical protein BCM02_104122 [Paenibacillus methanolicus]